MFVAGIEIWGYCCKPQFAEAFANMSYVRVHAPYFVNYNDAGSWVFDMN